MAGQSQQQNTDNSLGMLWGVLLSFTVLWVCWFFFHSTIAKLVITIRLYQAKLLAFCLPNTSALVTYLQLLNPNNVELSDLIEISDATGYYLRFPITCLLLIFAFFIYRSRATLQFTRHYNMQLLVAEEKKNWVQIIPSIQQNLVSADIDKGAWAMALTPLQFARQHHLVELERKIEAVSTTMMIVDHRQINAKLNHQKVHQIFILQLGAQWEGMTQLSFVAKALFAIFAARAVRDRKAADRLMWQISNSAKEVQYKSSEQLIQQLDFKGVDTLLKKYAAHPLVLQVTQQHAYVLTVMASMLVLARQDGVLASAEFLWLKPCDRRLWFMLNCVGRQTAYTEVAGPFAHWIAERTLGAPLKVPMVETAVIALETAVKEIRFSEEMLKNSTL